MLIKEQDGVKWMEFELLADLPGLTHGIFLKHGGVSQKEFASLNFSYFVGDDPENVKANEALAASLIGIPFDEEGEPKIAHSWVYHGADISEVRSENLQEPFRGDAITTQVPQIGLLMTHADCQASIIYDPKEKALAVIHSGWRSSILNIYRESVLQMNKRYGSKPENLLVGIGPSLGPESAEFTNYMLELPEQFWQYQSKPSFFDFWAISEWQLLSVGVLPHHIQIAQVDTFNNGQDFYSYRRDKTCGRHATIACIH